VGDGSGDGVGYWGDSFDGEGFFADNSVETVEGIGGVFHDTSCAIRVDQRVSTLDDISAARFLLALDVTGVGVVDGVSEVVVSWGIGFGDYGFSDGSGVSYWGYGSGDGGGVGDGRGDGPGDGGSVGDGGSYGSGDGGGVGDGWGSGVRQGRSGGVRQGGSVVA
jgi:hypothetical protein